MPLTPKQAAAEIGFRSARTVLKLPIERYRAGRQWFYEERVVQEFKATRTLRQSQRTGAVALAESATEALARLGK
jgi:hypothetical protein